MEFDTNLCPLHQHARHLHHHHWFRSSKPHEEDLFTNRLRRSIPCLFELPTKLRALALSDKFLEKPHMSKIRKIIFRGLHAYAATWKMLRIPGMICLSLATLMIIAGPIALTILDSPIVTAGINEHQLVTPIAVIVSLISHVFIWFVYTFKLMILIVAAGVIFVVATMIVYGASLGKLNLFDVFLTKEGIDQIGEMIRKSKESS